MLRWVPLVLRLALAGMGLLFVACFVFTLHFSIYAQGYGLSADLALGSIRVGASSPASGRRLEWAVAEAYWEPDDHILAMFPSPSPSGIFVPLWLLSALCLAWPVSSFIITRRKRRRGFPVISAKTTVQGPDHISLVYTVETGSTGLTQFCRVDGARAAEQIASVLRAKGVAVKVTHAGGDKRILQFPDSKSLAEAELDRVRYMLLVQDAAAPKPP